MNKAELKKKLIDEGVDSKAKEIFNDLTWCGDNDGEHMSMTMNSAEIIIKEHVNNIYKTLIDSVLSQVDDGWVSVQDRLPPIGIHVLCEINETMINELVNMVVIDYVEYNNGIFEFVHNYKHNYRRWRMIPPTPPKES